jgi:hypothetical protein
MRWMGWVLMVSGFGCVPSASLPQTETDPALHAPCDTPEVAYDGIDQDCDGQDLLDADGDGYDADFMGGQDCNDQDVRVHPDAEEIFYDGVDQDCAGDDDYDADGDGSHVDDDCDDRDASAYPGAEEVFYDGVDQACDGGDDYDRDADGVVFPADCDDTDPLVHPGAEEVFYDGIDGACDGGNDYDADRDGDESDAYGGTDCDDDDASVDGTDSDDDGFSTCTGDCDDTRSGFAPDQEDLCGDGVDQDCSGTADQGCVVEDMVVGRTYGLAMADVVAEPDLLILLGAFGYAIVFQVTDHDPDLSTIGVSVGSSSALGGLWTPDCSTLIEPEQAEFSADPVFQLGPLDYTMTYDWQDYDVEDFVVIGQFSGDGEAITGLVVAGRFDMRALESTVPAACALFATLGYGCEECRDGELMCLPFTGVAEEAPWLSEIDLDETCG